MCLFYVVYRDYCVHNYFVCEHFVEVNRRVCFIERKERTVLLES